VKSSGLISTVTQQAIPLGTIGFNRNTIKSKEESGSNNTGEYMKNLILIILSLAVLAGIFDSCMDVRRDRVDSVFSRVEAGWFQRWYEGGNENYSLPIWGPYDFWHFSKSCLMGTWCLIAALSFYAGRKYPDSYWWEVLLGALAIYWIEGITFASFYHVTWRL
jgi:hypothetical protein